MVKKIFCLSILFIVILFGVHVSYLINSFFSKNVDIKFLGNEILFLVCLVLVSVIMLHIIRKKNCPVKFVEKNLVVLGGIHIIVALILPRFASYEPGPIEILTLNSVHWLDGDMLMRGILILLLAYMIKRSGQYEV